MELNLENLLPLIKYPLLTEKSINLYNDRQYTFIVDRCLTKLQVKYVLEKIFNVNIISVNTSMLPKKKKRVGKFIGQKSRYKKVYIKLKVGQVISDLLN